MKGQIGIYLFMALLMDIIMLAILAPFFNSVIGLLTAAIDPSDSVSQLLARMIFPALIFSMIFGILAYKDPLGQRNY